MFKRTLNRLLIRIKRATYSRGAGRHEYRLSDQRVVAAAFRMVSQAAPERLTGAPQVRPAAREISDSPEPAVHVVNNSEVDRMLETRGKRTVMVKHQKIINLGGPIGIC